MLEKNWKISINKQRVLLAQELSTPIKKLAIQCAQTDLHRAAIETLLSHEFQYIPHCTFLYVLDTNGVQICSNVSASGLLSEYFSRDRSTRPYMEERIPEEGFLLSDAYISQNSMRPSITALQYIKNSDNEILGYLGADFDLRNLPIAPSLYQEPEEWRQIKGDPAIRGMVFQQSRVESVLDQNIGQVFAVLEELFTQRGMFQGVFHFSSSRATVWVIDDPYRYRILDNEALSDTDICMAYPSWDYP